MKPGIAPNHGTMLIIKVDNPSQKVVEGDTGFLTGDSVGEGVSAGVDS
ncbi:MAG: hypothetical protein IKM27_03560 [Clostridia bacterium]|nr:hypothetical protein [Clostridia bacterium]